MSSTTTTSKRLLAWAIPALGIGLWLAAAPSRPAAAQASDHEQCRATLQECSNLVNDVQRQRDTALAASDRCETALKDANLKLELLKKSKTPGGLTHRDALALMDLSMSVLQEAATEPDIPAAELLEATRKLKLYQKKATGISLQLTHKATTATQAAAAAER